MDIAGKLKSLAGMVSLTGLYGWIILLVLAHVTQPVWGPAWDGLIGSTIFGGSPQVPAPFPQNEESCLVIDGIEVCDTSTGDLS